MREQGKQRNNDTGYKQVERKEMVQILMLKGKIHIQLKFNNEIRFLCPSLESELILVSLKIVKYII